MTTHPFVDLGLLRSAVPGAPPTNVRGENLSSESLLIQWAPPPPDQQNGQILGYKVIWMKGHHTDVTKSQNMVNMARDTRSRRLDSLDKYQEYSVWVKAYTAIGDGPASDAIHVWTDEDGRWSAGRKALLKNLHQMCSLIYEHIMLQTQLSSLLLVAVVASFHLHLFCAFLLLLLTNWFFSSNCLPGVCMCGNWFVWCGV